MDQDHEHEHEADSPFHSLVHASFYIIYTFSIVANVTLLYLLLFHTPRNLRVYSISLISLSVVDILSSLTLPLTVPSFILVGPVLVSFYHGVCTNYGTQVCTTLFGIGMSAMMGSYPALAVSFAYRFRGLTSNKMQCSDVICACIFVHLGSTIMFVASTLDQWEEISVRKYLFANELGNITRVEKHISGMKPFPTPGIIYILLWACVGTSLSFILILYYRYRIHKRLKNSEQYMSQQTVNMHSMLIRAITIQACLPIISMLILLVDLLDIVWHIPISHKDELQFSILGILPALTPCVSLYFIVPYRRKVCAIFRKTYCRSSSSPATKNAAVTVVFAYPDRVTGLFEHRQREISQVN